MGLCAPSSNISTLWHKAARDDNYRSTTKPSRLPVAPRLDAGIKRNHSAGRVLVNHAALDYKHNAPNAGNVFQRVSIERNDVRLKAAGDRANLIAQAQRFRASELAETIATIGPKPQSRTRSMISSALRPWAPATASVPKTIFQPRSFCRVSHDLVVHRLDLLHRSKSLDSVALCAEIPFPVLPVVLNDQPALRIETGARLCHQFQVVIWSQHTVLNLSAPRESRRADCLFAGMHEPAQSLLLCFITSRVQLFLRKRREDPPACEPRAPATPRRVRRMCTWNARWSRWWTISASLPPSRGRRDCA